MSDTDNDQGNSIGMKLPRFNGKRGEDYGMWRHRLRAVCRLKGVWFVVDTSSSSGTVTESTEEFDHSSPRLIAKREKASGIIISSLGDSPLRVVIDADDDPAQMLKVLDSRYASNRTVSRIAVQTQLFRMSYNGQDMSTFIDQYTTLFSQLERMGKDSAIPDTHKAPMLLASIDPTCSLESTAAALRTKDVTELTWDYVATTLIDEYNAKHSNGSGLGIGNGIKNRRKKKKANIRISNSNGIKPSNDSDDSSDVDNTVRALTVAIKSMKGGKNKNLRCTFCEKSGHSEDRCFNNPNNPENKLPLKIQQMITQTKKGSTCGDKDSEKKPNKKVEIAGAVVHKTTVLPPQDNRSYADSGATGHFFHSHSLFDPVTIRKCETTMVVLADKTTVSSNKCGDVVLPFENANIRLKNTFLVPNLGYNLVSTGRLADNGIESHFRRNDVRLLIEKDGFLIGTGKRDTDTSLYMLPEPVNQESNNQALKVCESKNKSQTNLWHRRLAHINIRDLANIHKHADGVPILHPTDEVCRACRLGKAHKLPFTGKFLRSPAVGDIIHSDIMGKLEPSFPFRFQYIATFLDDHSRYLLLGYMERRSMLGEVFSQISAKFVEMGGATILISKIHSDGAKEYVALQKELGGVTGNNSFSPPYTPELNGIAERVNRTIVEAALALLIQADLPSCLWTFAIKHVVHVRNRVPHATINKTPYSVLTKKKPSLKHVRVFGCAAFVLRIPRGSKFESRAIEGVYLETIQYGVYKILITDESDIPRIIESRHVTFDETRFPGAPNLISYMDDMDSSDEMTSERSDGAESSSEYGDYAHSVPVEEGNDFNLDTYKSSSDQDDVQNDFDGDLEDDAEADLQDDIEDDTEDEIEDDIEDDVEDGNVDEVVPGPQEEERYPRRNRQKPQKWYVASSADHKSPFRVTTSDEPTLREAMSATLEEKEMWESAINEEFESLDSKRTWDLDNRQSTQPLPTHVILKVKRKSNGMVDRFKARVVAGGNYQTYGENYKETYAPVVSFSLVRIFLYLVLSVKMHVVQLDVKTAFLNGELLEDVWVMSPRGIPERAPRCYKLLKAIYGLKQAHLAWHTKLSSDLHTMGFEELPSAPCVFCRKNESSRSSFILVYVDDLLILAENVTEKNVIVNELKALYDLRISEKVDLFLGVQLKWKDGSELVLSQSLYVNSILRRFGLEDSKPACTPMVESFFTGFSAEEEKSIVNVELYQQMIGSLLYLALRTRLDILAPVLILARFQKAPTSYCHRGVKRVLRYLKGTSTVGIRYQCGRMDIQAFVDADYAADVTDRKSMSGYLVKIGDATCVWGSKKQHAVALSTCESEYYAMALAASECVWVRRVLREAGIKIDGPTPIRSDNQAAIKWASGEKCPSSRAKHIDVRVHLIRQFVTNCTLEVVYIPSEENDADMLTKPIGPILLKQSTKRVGLVSGIEEEC